MKRLLPVFFSVALSALTLLLIAVAAKPGAAALPEVSPESAGNELPAEQALPSANPESNDSRQQITVLVKGEPLSMSLADYLRGVTASEVPGTFYPEAIKAQAVAARTNLYWKLNHTNPGHPGADVCDDPSHCAAYASDEELREKWSADKFDALMTNIANAVIATDGVLVRYKGEVIQAVFHSSGGGYTENSGNVWTEQLPYLTARESPEGSASVPNFISEYAFTIEEFKRLAKEKYPEVSFDPGLLSGEVRSSETTRLISVVLGDKRISATELRLLYGLRSAMATWTVDGNEIRFTTKGYGHGVGLSQYGANEFARNGAAYEDILTYYYKGSSVS